MPSKSSQLQLSNDEEIWCGLAEFIRTQKLNGDMGTVLKNVREMHAALSNQIGNIVQRGKISEDKLVRFINCYDIPSKLKERVASAVRAAIINSICRK